MKPKGWAKFQHYKNRRPPWIKLHRDLLDREEYHTLDPLAAKYLPLLWLIASESKEGELPASKPLAFRLRISLSELTQILRSLSEWFEESASTSLSPCAQVATPEGEGETEIEEEKKPLPKPRKRVSEIKHSADPRHMACKESIFTYYRAANKGKDPPWDGREGRALGMLLGADPAMTAGRITELLRHRFKSEVTHGDRPALWISKVHSYENGPLNQYGKPMQIGATNGRINPNIAALREALAEGQDQDSTYPNGHDAGREVGRRHDQALLRSLSARAV